jgi:omega-3 fatty acid desaturase (delta-15 desaturase)
MDDYDTKTYPEGEWNYVLGGVETIDREFGFGLDAITHHITVRRCRLTQG